MQDDRERYLAEAEVQADGLADYVMHFIGASSARTLDGRADLLRPRDQQHRLHVLQGRISSGCVPRSCAPGLVPPFGPPGHPAFPSGHSFLGHLIALFLLEIPAIAERYGVFRGAPARVARDKAGSNSLRTGRGRLPLALAGPAPRPRTASGSASTIHPTPARSRHLAAGIWWALLREPDGQPDRLPDASI